MPNKFELDKLLNNVSRVKREVPILIANQAQNYFVSSFTKQGWSDTGAWKEVKRRIEGTTEYKYPAFKGLSRRTKPILVMSGRLRRAVSGSIREATFDRIRLVVALPYAAAQNYGNNKIVARKFMGDSRELREKQLRLIKTSFDKAFNV
jgi:hypothetical protein